MNLRGAIGLFLPLAAAGPSMLACAQQTVPDALETCTAIASAAERLACYDQLTGHAKAPKPAPTSLNPPSPPKTQPDPDPSPKGAQGSLTTVGAAASPSLAAPGSQTTTAPASAAAFGLYSAEHPTLPTLQQSITATITDAVARRDGHQLLVLEGGQLWELDGTDWLLAKGKSVTIKRAALGSYIVKTPTGRTFRAKRWR